MAKLLNCAENHYQRFEYGQSNPPYDKLIKLCEHFGVSLDWLITGRDHVLDAIGGGFDDYAWHMAGRITALSEESRNDLEKYLQMLELRDSIKG